MRLIYVVGCCLTLAMVLTLSDALLWGGKQKPAGDVEVGLVKAKKPSPSPAANPAQKPSTPQDGTKKPATQASGASKTNTVTDHNKTDPKQGSPPQDGTTNPATQAPGTSKTTTGIDSKKTDSKQGSPPQDGTTKPATQAPGTSKTTTGIDSKKTDPKQGSPPPMKVDEKVMQNPNSKAVVMAGATAVAVVQKQNDKNQETAKKLEKKLDSLDRDLKSKKPDESLSDFTRNVLEVTKKRIKVKTAVAIYAIIHFILYIAQYAGSVITPPVGKAIYFLDLIAKQVVRKPLDDYYAEYKNAEAEAIAKFLQKHKHEFQNVQVGKKILIKTASGKHTFKVLKDNPGELLNEEHLHVADKGVLDLFRTAVQMKR